MLEWGQTLSMSVYLKDGIERDVREEIASIIRGLPGAEITDFISKQQAEADLIAALGEQAGLLDGITSNPLPASFEINFRDIKNDQVNPRRISVLLEQLEGVDEVQYSEQWLERFEGLLYILKVGGLIVAGLFSLAVLFIITNTIKLTIYSRRDEIEIMRLVGATDRFIKIPFYLQGMIQGGVGTLLGLVVLLIGYLFLTTHFEQTITNSLLVLRFFSLSVCATIIFGGILVGGLGSLVSLKQFMKI